MSKQRRRVVSRPLKPLTLPELEQSKGGVLNSLGSLSSRRSYRHAIDEFIAWYCSEPRLALNRAVVLRYRMHLERSSCSCASPRLGVLQGFRSPACSLSLGERCYIRPGWPPAGRAGQTCRSCCDPLLGDKRVPRRFLEIYDVARTFAYLDH